ESYPDAEASVTSGRLHEEFATRRGGRRRRRPGPRQQGHPESNGSNGKDSESDVEPIEAAPEPEPAPAPAEVTPPAPRESRRPDGQRESRRPDGHRRHPPRRERTQPAITDLLRDGQEILVQIAKEPIAKKGARITSHIALPGRFLVYMPTVEHLG